MILGKQTLIKLIFLLLLVLALSSCSAQKKEENEAPAEVELEIIQEETASLEVEAREPIYVYPDQAQAATSERISLSINDEPLLLPRGYVRLVGVVSGGRPMALVEVGGRGVCLGVGERIGKYRVVNISKNVIRLIRKEDS